MGDRGNGDSLWLNSWNYVTVTVIHTETKKFLAIIFLAALLWLSTISHLYAFYYINNPIGSYSVVAPKLLRPYSDFTIVVSTHGTKEPVRVILDIGGKENAGGVFLKRQIIALELDSSKMVKFQIGELGPGQYNLTVSGNGGISFTNTIGLQYERKSYSVFIQTDLEVYNPGDTIRFRAVVVNPVLKPFVNKAINVYITDGAGNRVKQWLKVLTNKGVFSGEILLSEELVLGNWTISVDMLGQRTSVTVLVVEETLPKFRVEVLLPQFATFEDKVVVATVKAQYSFGRSVNGNVTLQVKPTLKYAYLHDHSIKPFSKVKPILGKTVFSFNIATDLRLKEEYVQELEFQASVQEYSTGWIHNSSSFITIFRYPYKMKFLKTSSRFKPGLKYTAFIKIAYHDDTPVSDGELTVSHSFSRNQSSFEVKRHKVPPDGLVTLEFYPPSDPYSNLVVKAQYADLTQLLAEVAGAQSLNNTFLQASLVTQKPEVGKEVVFELNSTLPMTQVIYEIFGRGQVVASEILQIDGQTRHLFRFVAQESMAPQAWIIVYYINHLGEMAADSFQFPVEGAIMNKVSISIDPTTTNTRGDISITVRTNPNNFVGIAGFDQRGLFTIKGGRLTKNVIIGELESYDPSKIDTSPWYYFEKHGGDPLLSNHRTSASDIFTEAGAVILTNGLLFDSEIFRNMIAADSKNISETIIGSSLNSVIGKPESNHGTINSTHIRYFVGGKMRLALNETLQLGWIFKDSISRSDGAVTMQERAPDLMGSYLLSAFAIDESHGLGVTNTQAKLTISRPFFATVHIPPSILRGEAVAIEVFVFNYGEKEVSANVTLFNSGPLDFQFPEGASEINRTLGSSYSKMVVVPAESIIPLPFLIVPQKLGILRIKVLVVSSTAIMDIVEKELLVKPDGLMLTINQAFLVNGGSFYKSVVIKPPQNIVDGSLRIYLSVVGDAIGSIIYNLDSFLQIPSGNSEQNLEKMFSNIILLEYLKSTNKYSSEHVEKALKNLHLGYQRQLTFRHRSGSFSEFGERDKSGSIWITAYSAQCLVKARKYIYTEDSVIAAAANWLMENQQLDGSFHEKGTITNRAIQGASVPLTAYVAISLFYLRKAGFDNDGSAINSAFGYLISKVETMSDPYHLAITTYALNLVNNFFKDEAFNKFENQAKSEDGMKWWEEKRSYTTMEKTVDSTVIDIEMTSYALLTYSIRHLVTEALPIIDWLTSQRNQHRGIPSIQDSALGMSAVASIAKLMGNAQLKGKIVYETGTLKQTVDVNGKNALLLQKEELMNDTSSVKIKASGSGFAFTLVTYNYNVKETVSNPAFQLRSEVYITADRNSLAVTVCIRYTYGGASNMAVLDVSLPSGYIIDDDLISSLYYNDQVKRVQNKENDAGVLLYFNTLSFPEVCPTIYAYRVFKIALHKASPILLYDYYDFSRQASHFYILPPNDLCDICTPEECDQAACQQEEIDKRISNENKNRESKENKTHQEDSANRCCSLNCFAYQSTVLLLLLLFNLWLR